MNSVNIFTDTDGHIVTIEIWDCADPEGTRVSIPLNPAAAVVLGLAMQKGALRCAAGMVSAEQLEAIALSSEHIDAMLAAVTI